jgi:hypothetical protein
MDELNSVKQTCSCGKHIQETNIPAVKHHAKPLKYFFDFVRSLFSFLLSLLIAFFPKCPVCWGVYMSMFGGLGLAQLPYLKWLLPVLLLLFALNLFLLYRKGKKTGYGPFLLTLAGALIILVGRTFFIADKELLYAGMLMVLSGSLWSSFSGIRFKIATHSTA